MLACMPQDVPACRPSAAMLQVLFGLAQLVVVCIGLSEAVRTANSIRDTSPWDDDTIRNGDSAMITTVVSQKVPDADVCRWEFL